MESENTWRKKYFVKAGMISCSFAGVLSCLIGLTLLIAGSAIMIQKLGEFYDEFYEYEQYGMKPSMKYEDVHKSVVIGAVLLSMSFLFTTTGTICFICSCCCAAAGHQNLEYNGQPNGAWYSQEKPYAAPFGTSTFPNDPAQNGQISKIPSPSGPAPAYIM